MFIDAAEQKLERREGLRALFQADRVRDTLALWVAFFLSLFAVYTAFSWLPTMLASEGANVAHRVQAGSPPTISAACSAR